MNCTTDLPQARDKGTSPTPQKPATNISMTLTMYLRLLYPLSVCLYYYHLPHTLSLPPSFSVSRPLPAPPVFPQHKSRGVYPQAAPIGGSHSATGLQ